MEWNTFYEEHAPALLLYARQWTHSQVEAEDVLQEGFIRFWTAYEDGRIRKHNPVGALYVTVKHVALDRYRSRKRREAREDRAGKTLSDTVSYFQDTLEQEELAEEVQDALAELPEEQREVIIMRIWGELKFREIAEALGESQNTVAARYRYGLAAMNRALRTSEVHDS